MFSLRRLASGRQLTAGGVILGLVLAFWLIRSQSRLTPRAWIGLTTAGVEPPPCGAVCSYDIKDKQDQVGSYPLLRKEVNCGDIMKRMAYRDQHIEYPPPEYPPHHLIPAYTMHGNMPIHKVRYLKDEWINHTARKFSSNSIDDKINSVRQHKIVNSYKDSGLCVEDTLERYSGEIRGGRGVVIGTLSPWLEAILLANGAEHVTTLEYGDIDLDHPQLQTHNPYDFAEMYLRNETQMFDFGASFSSLEHSGLGRYGDPLNPYGDLEAMAQVWCMVKPGGMFAVGVPSHKTRNYIVWNAHRIYSSIRLQHLTANWQVVELVTCKNNNTFIVLKKLS